MSRYYPGKHLIDVPPIQSRFNDLSIEDTEMLKRIWFLYGRDKFRFRDVEHIIGKGNKCSKIRHREYIVHLGYHMNDRCGYWRIKSERAARLELTFGEGWNPYKWFWEQI